jgi:phage baseplate assembly protein W
MLDGFLLLRTPSRQLLTTTVGLALHRRKFGCSPPYIYAVSLSENRIFFCVFQIQTRIKISVKNSSAIVTREYPLRKT